MLIFFLLLARTWLRNRILGQHAAPAVRGRRPGRRRRPVPGGEGRERERERRGERAGLPEPQRRSCPKRVVACRSAAAVVVSVGGELFSFVGRLFFGQCMHVDCRLCQKGNWDRKRKLVSCQRQAAQEAISEPCLLWSKTKAEARTFAKGLSPTPLLCRAWMSVGGSSSRDNTPFLEKGLVGESVGWSVDEERLSGVSMHRS